MRYPVPLSLVFLGACGTGFPCSGPAEPAGPFPVTSGHRSLSAVILQSDELPFGLKEDVQLDVDRSSGTVTLSYVDEGAGVREVWRITKSGFAIVP